MNHLRKELSPLSPEAWAAIEDEARDTLKACLSARKLVDFDGPHGWAHAAVNLGRADAVPFEHTEAGSSVTTKVRRTAPLMELKVPFKLSLCELDDIERGATDVNLDPVVNAAKTLASAEDQAVFYGVKALDIAGMSSGSEHAPIALEGGYEGMPQAVSAAIATLRKAGVNGPYALALDAEAYAAVLQATGPGGYPVLQHLRRLLDGPTIWAPALKGAAVVSMRGGDFQLVVGQDISVGYSSHTSTEVELYLEESFTFRLLGPEAVVTIQP